MLEFIHCSPPDAERRACEDCRWLRGAVSLRLVRSPFPNQTPTLEQAFIKRNIWGTGIEIVWEAVPTVGYEEAYPPQPPTPASDA